MNTTNLITDYIITGILGVFTFFIPYILLDSRLVETIFNTEIKNTTIWAVLITAVGYSLGVVFNQLSDYLEEKIYFILGNKITQNAETDLKNRLGFDHHYALQITVAKSQTAYDYVSFRRTMIRIMRSFLTFTFLLPFVHLLYSLAFVVLGNKLMYSFRNTLVLTCSVIVGFFIYKNLKKLYRGYYGALTNFALILNR